MDDFVKETAETNARMREIHGAVRRRAEAAIVSRDVDVLLAALAGTLEFLDTVVADLTESRAFGALLYQRDPEFRNLIDRVAHEE